MTVLTAFGRVRGMGGIAAPFFVDIDHVSATSATSIAVPIPTGNVGDFLVVEVWQSQARPFGAVAGWTAQTTLDLTGQPAYRMYTRVATGSEGSTVTVPITGGTSPMQGVCHRYRNVRTGVVGKASQQLPPAGGSVTAPSVTPTAAGLLVCSFCQIADTDLDATPPAGFIERADVPGPFAPGTAGIHFMVATKTAPVSSGSPTGTFAATGFYVSTAEDFDATTLVLA